MMVSGIYITCSVAIEYTSW